MMKDTYMVIHESKIVPDIQCETKVTLNGAQLAEVYLTDIMGSELKIVDAARMCRGTGANNMGETEKKTLKFLLDHEHMSVFEHAALTFKVVCPLPIRTHLFRYRTASPTEWSHRGVDSDPQFYIPDLPEDVKREVEALVSDSVDIYRKLLSIGKPAGVARMFLLQAMMTKFEWTIDLRNFIHVWQERTANGVQEETKAVVKAMAHLASNYFPNIAEYFKWRLT